MLLIDEGDTQEEGWAAEEKWIRLMYEQGEVLLNSRFGGRSNALMPEARLRFAAAHRTPEAMENHNRALRNKSPEWEANVAKALRNKSPEWRAKVTVAMRKRAADPEWQERIGKMFASDEWQEKVRASQTPEWRQKISATIRNKPPEWWASNAAAVRAAVKKPEWKLAHKAAMQRRGSDPEWRLNNAEAVRAAMKTLKVKARMQVGQATYYATAPHTRLNPQFYDWLYIWRDGNVYVKK